MRLIMAVILYTYVIVFGAVFAIDFNAVQAGALAGAAVLSVPITHALKKAAKWNDGAALILSAVIAAALTVAAMFFTGQAHSVTDVISNAAAVFGVGQFIFRSLTYGQRAVNAPSS